MDPEIIQNDIDALLTFMNDDMERIGGTIKDTHWGFALKQEDRNAIETLYGWSDEHIRFFPASQYFNADNLSGPGIHYRLVPRNYFPVTDGLAEFLAATKECMPQYRGHSGSQEYRQQQ